MSSIVPVSVVLRPIQVSLPETPTLPEAVLASEQSTQPVLAQQFDQDVIADLGDAMQTFVDSGQVWALIIGFALGFLIRGITTYN